jgi:hypothetical protein
MKTSIKTLVAIMAIGLHIGSAHAQTVNNTAGVYLTEQDYKTGKLSYTLGQNDKMHLNDFLDGKNISLNYQGKKVKLAKSEVFGYRLNNHDFRLYRNEAYEILDTAGFLLYSRSELVQQGKGLKPVSKYFYSVDEQKPVLGLTLDNIYKSFPADAGFRYNVQSTFHQDNELIRFDRSNKQYEIKYLYQEYKHSGPTQHA